ncbi:MAG: ATP-binding protein, partial [Hyphomicrobiaceae bacterium]
MSDFAPLYDCLRHGRFDDFSLDLIIDPIKGPRREEELWDYKKVFIDRALDPSGGQSMASLIKDVVAFHNSYGGVLLSGIDDSTREVCGDDVGLDGAGLTVEDLRARVTAATGVDIALRYGRFRHAPSGRTVCALFIPQRARFNPPVELKSDSKERKGGDKGDKRPIYVR